MGIFFFIRNEGTDYSYLKKLYKKNDKLDSIPENSFPIKCLNGTFVGKEKENVISYKGIPFAKPPIRNLRWRPPVECDNSDDIFEAYAYQKSPVQRHGEGEAASFYEIGEDCLYLNIWRYNDGEKNKPVMVFIHGGGYGWGGTVDPTYDGHNFVKVHKDIIFVTITYRVSILGFMDLTNIKGGESYKESPNLGMLDQVQALKWINKNIENFGGDKNNVTIVGESAGGGSVTMLPLIKGTKGLFKRIISQSGSFCWNITKEEGKRVIVNLKSEIKKYRKEEIDMDYLLSLSEEEIINLNLKLNDYCLPPMRDGYIIPEDCYGEIERGAYDGIDLIIGSNRDEVKYYRILFGCFFNMAIRLYVENIIYHRIEKNGVEIFNKFKKCVDNPLENFLNDLYFRGPALKIAQLHSRNKNNTYCYYWTYPYFIPQFGACHAVELTYVLNNLQLNAALGDKTINYKLAQQAQNMWVNFAKTGNPSTEEIKWEKYDEKNQYFMVFGKETELKKDIFSKERDDIILPLMEKYIPYQAAELSLNVPMMKKAGLIFLTIFVLIMSLFLRKFLK